MPEDTLLKWAADVTWALTEQCWDLQRAANNWIPWHCEPGQSLCSVRTLLQSFSDPEKYPLLCLHRLRLGSSGSKVTDEDLRCPCIIYLDFICLVTTFADFTVFDHLMREGRLMVTSPSKWVLQTEYTSYFLN